MNVAVRLFQLLPSAECCQFQHSSSWCTVQIHIQSAQLVLFRYTAGIFSVLLWMWQSVCSSYCCQLNAVSFSTALHDALYRSIYSLLIWSSLGTLQGILGAFAKFRIGTVSFVMSDRPSVRMEQLGSHWTDFQNFRFVYFSKSSREHFSFTKNNKNTSYFMWRPIYIYNFISFCSSYNEKYFRQTFREIQNTFMVQYFFFLKSWFLWHNAEKCCALWQSTDDNTAQVQCMLDT